MVRRWRSFVCCKLVLMAIVKRVKAEIKDDTCLAVPTVVRKQSMHDELVLRAEKWLKSQNCQVVIRDPFRSWNREQPDAIGWRSDVSILVEVKVSRADFLADAKKHFRVNPDTGMGDWRFYLSPPGIVNPEDLPEGWGLLWAYAKQIKKVQGVPPNSRWSLGKPYRGNKDAENTMLVSALRRLTHRGYLPEIYDGPQSR